MTATQAFKKHRAGKGYQCLGCQPLGGAPAHPRWSLRHIRPISSRCLVTWGQYAHSLGLVGAGDREPGWSSYLL